MNPPLQKHKPNKAMKIAAEQTDLHKLERFCGEARNLSTKFTAAK